MPDRGLAARTRVHAAPSPRTLARVAVIAGALVVLQLALTLTDAWLSTQASARALRDTYGYVGDVVEARVAQYVDGSADAIDRLHAQVAVADFDALDVMAAAEQMAQTILTESSVSGLMVGLPDGSVAGVQEHDDGFTVHWSEPTGDGDYALTTVTTDVEGVETGRSEEVTAASGLDTAWYQAGSTAVGIEWTDPYRGEFSSGTYVSPTRAVHYDGELVAVVAAQFERERLVDIMEDVPTGKGTVAMVLGDGDTVIAAPSSYEGDLDIVDGSGCFPPRRTWDSSRWISTRCVAAKTPSCRWAMWPSSNGRWRPHRDSTGCSICARPSRPSPPRRHIPSSGSWRSPDSRWCCPASSSSWPFATGGQPETRCSAPRWTRSRVSRTGRN
ncbi:hypothetical protein [Demequina litorisediminis]|uniref:hypothetical protein n=1 Tax=Demequina litorisediminis TaxID=1849022 RepID=UPI0024E12001|nr:hypothetical protein [Demequina litorisediminis]